MGRCRPLLARLGCLHLHFLGSTEFTSHPTPSPYLLSSFWTLGVCPETWAVLVSGQATNTVVTLWLLDLRDVVEVTQLPYKGLIRHLWDCPQDPARDKKLCAPRPQGPRAEMVIPRQEVTCHPPGPGLSSCVIMAEAFREPLTDTGCEGYPKQNCGSNHQCLTWIPRGSSWSQKKVPPALEYKLPSSSH